MKIFRPGGFATAVVLVGAAASVARAVALLKELAVAARFGTGDALDAFLLALAVPMFVAGAFRSALLSSLVPRLVSARERDGDERAESLLASSLSRHLIVAAALAAVLALAAEPTAQWLGGSFDEGKRALTARLLRALALFVLADGVAAVWTAALHARGRLVMATLGTASAPLATLAALALLSGARPEILVLGTLAGALVEAVWAAALLRREGIRPFRWGPPLAPEARSAGRGFALLASGSVLMSLNPIVDQIMAAWLDPGSVASLAYGGRLASGVVSLAGTALATAAFPRYARFAASGDRGTLGRAFRRDVLASVLLGVGAAATLFALSTPIVRVVFQRGAFTSADTLLVSRIQAFYVLQIPGYLAGLLAARVLNALGRDGTMLAMAAGGALLNVGANLVLMRWLGAPGIALSTSVVYSMTALVLVWSSARAREGAGR